MIYVVRHGHTDWNKEKITMGRKDIPLNDEGLEEAHNTSKKINNIDFDLIISSPLVRAKQTAEIINEERNNQIVFDERIQERSLGDLEEKKYTNDNNDIWDINLNVDSFGIETMEDFKERVFSFLNEIIETYPEQNILLVTHGGVSALINCYFNNSLYEGSISNKFLKNCEYTCYGIEKNKVLKKNINLVNY